MTTTIFENAERARKFVEEGGDVMSIVFSGRAKRQAWVELARLLGVRIRKRYTDANQWDIPLNVSTAKIQLAVAERIAARRGELPESPVISVVTKSGRKAKPIKAKITGPTVWNVGDQLIIDIMSTHKVPALTDVNHKAKKAVWLHILSKLPGCVRGRDYAPYWTSAELRGAVILWLRSHNRKSLGDDYRRYRPKGKSPVEIKAIRKRYKISDFFHALKELAEGNEERAIRILDLADPASGGKLSPAEFAELLKMCDEARHTRMQLLRANAHVA